MSPSRPPSRAMISAAESAATTARLLFATNKDRMRLSRATAGTWQGTAHRGPQFERLGLLVTRNGQRLLGAALGLLWVGDFLLEEQSLRSSSSPKCSLSAR